MLSPRLHDTYGLEPRSLPVLRRQADHNRQAVTHGSGTSALLARQTPWQRHDRASRQAVSGFTRYAARTPIVHVLPQGYFHVLLPTGRMSGDE
jgi:hypothetical protein